jgi:hypothetical protein
MVETKGMSSSELYSRDAHLSLRSSEGQRGINNSTKWLQRVLPELIVFQRNTKSQAIVEVIQPKYHVSINKLPARRAKHTLLGRSVADLDR